MANYQHIKSEATLCLEVGKEFFPSPTYQVTLIDKRVDFIVSSPADTLFYNPFVWAEAKLHSTDVAIMFAQLILTLKPIIDKGEMPPNYLCAFDREKIAFLEYRHILPLLILTDFNWNEKASSPPQKVIDTVAEYIKEVVVFDFAKDHAILCEFIAKNFIVGKYDTTKAQINKNNFLTVYYRWAKEVKPTIAVDWDLLNSNGIVDGDFYLADLLSKDNVTIVDGLDVVLNHNGYQYAKQMFKGMLFAASDGFTDRQKAHAAFWARYERPPKEEYHDYILDRHALIVPQNIREREGAFYTPEVWVEKSQEYLEKTFGENWQDEYYVWDCCAGTCNLLYGLTQKDRVWASTLYPSEVKIVHGFIDKRSFFLSREHVFQFDFLNDDFSKLPQDLQDVINDPEKQKKLIIYINPPYAETSGGKRLKKDVATKHKTYKEYKDIIGTAINEVFAHFFAKIYDKMPNAKLAAFSKLKYVNAPNFIKFREFFLAQYKAGFIVRADTFENVKGKFPIGFLIWDMEQKEKIDSIACDVLDINKTRNDARKVGKKMFYAYNSEHGFINDWYSHFYDNKGEEIGVFYTGRNDFQHNNLVRIMSVNNFDHTNIITIQNLRITSIYLTVRHVFKHLWIKDRDQFLYPNNDYQKDTEFQNDCLVFALFHNQNYIRSRDGINHWIPFAWDVVDAKTKFSSTFMWDYLQCRHKQQNTDKMLFEGQSVQAQRRPYPADYSEPAQAVYNAGLNLWRYYHQIIKDDDSAMVNASLYEIREYFKGRNDKGTINTKSADPQFTALDAALKEVLDTLALKIQPKVYEYGFLKE